MGRQEESLKLTNEDRLRVLAVAAKLKALSAGGKASVLMKFMNGALLFGPMRCSAGGNRSTEKGGE